MSRKFQEIRLLEYQAHVTTVLRSTSEVSQTVTHCSRPSPSPIVETITLKLFVVPLMPCFAVRVELFNSPLSFLVQLILSRYLIYLFKTFHYKQAQETFKIRFTISLQ